MSFSQAELTALKEAYAKGVKSVTYDGKTVVYDNEAALLRRIQKIENELTAGTANAKPRGAFARFRRGFC